MFHFFQAHARTNGFSRLLLGAAMGAVLAGAGGCSSLPSSPLLTRAVSHQGWLQLEGGHITEVSAGLFLELPRAPYRARFSDADGTYYQAALPLVYRTRQGSVTAVAGGLYVAHDRPDEARSWTEPVFFTPTRVYSTVYPVRMFPGS